MILGAYIYDECEFLYFIPPGTHTFWKTIAAENSCKLRLVEVNFLMKNHLYLKLVAVSVKLKTEKSVQTEKSIQVDFDWGQVC